MSIEETKAKEAAWLPRAGAAGIAGAILALAGFFLLRIAIGGGVNFEGLENAHDSAGLAWLSGVTTCLGYGLLTVPLFFLFKAAQAREPRVRAQMVGLVVMGPLLLGISGLLLAAGTQEAADSYLNKEVTISSTEVKEAREDCDEELEDKGRKQFAEDFDEGASPEAACDAKKLEEKKGSKAIKDAGMVTLGSFLGFAGGLSLVVALFYTGLWSMRTGLLTRFWGSLGMAVGVMVLLGLTPLALLWFAYVGVLFLGAVPGGRPPAWAAGESIPWPTPGEQAAAKMEGDDSDVVDGEAEELPDGDPDPGSGPSGETPKKRKKRE
jgi:hypothetical protein